MKCQGFFSVKNKRNIANSLSAEYVHRVVKVKLTKQILESTF